MRLLTSTATGLLLVLLSCSNSALKSAGTECGSDSECSAGLSCLALGAVTDAGCTTIAKACSKPCTLDSDCASVGSSFKCFGNCSGTRACAETK